jgi:hypothetical protein
MSQKQKFDLSAIASAISDAASSETMTRDKWLRAAKAMHKAGLTPQMLMKGTEKAPNEQYNESAYLQVRSYVVQGVSAAKKTVKLSTVVPGSISDECPKGSHNWTVAELLALTQEQLKEIDDDVLKTQRRAYMQLVDGTMMGRVRSYLDRECNPEKHREARAVKAEQKLEPSTMRGDTLDGAKLMLRALLAGKNSVCGTKTLSRYENALTEALACLS